MILCLRSGKECPDVLCLAGPALVVHAEPFARRDAGMAPKPDSTIVSFVPPGGILELNDTSVVGLAE